MNRIVSFSIFMCILAVSASAQVVGVRGDGSGDYPKASPPVKWDFGTPLEGVTWQAAMPGDDKPAGKPLADGVIRGWLVAGPFDVAKDAAPDAEIVKGEADFAPTASQKIGDLAWKEVASDESLLNLAAMFDNKLDAAAYAFAAIYAPADTTVAANLITGGRSVVWLNGKVILKQPDKDAQFIVKSLAMPLKKGWNRLLVRTMPSKANNVYTAFLYASFRGDPKAQPTGKNILWSTSGCPDGPINAGERMISFLGGAAAPIVVGDRLFLQSEPYDLVQVDKNTGKVLGVRSNNYFEATPAADRKDKAEFDEAKNLAIEINKINNAWPASGTLTKEQVLAKDALHKKLYDAMKKIDPEKYTFTKEQDLGMAGFVPVSDGKLVWAWYASGIAACYDFEGGRRWITLDNRGGQHHGFHTSPMLVDGKFIVYMGDIRCLDAATGKQLWAKTICKDPKEHWSSAFEGSFCPLSVGGLAMFMTPNGDIDRVSDGEKLFGDRTMSGMIQRPTPVVQGDTVYKLDSGGTLHIIKLPKEASGDKLEAVSNTKVKLDATGYRLFFGDCWQASPLVHEGLVYCLHNSGLLSVVDAEKGQVVYRKLLDLDVMPGWSLIAPNLALAGGKVYATSCTGTCVVFEPGREFKQVAKNRVSAVVGPGQWWQRSERFAASPVFDGKRVYLRGEANLYCIEEK